MSIAAAILVIVLTSVLVSGCMTRIDISDFTVPELVVSYEGDWYYCKHRGVSPADYVLATVITDAVVTDSEIGKEGDYYIVEEDGSTDIMDAKAFKAAYKRLTRFKK